MNSRRALFPRPARGAVLPPVLSGGWRATFAAVLLAALIPASATTSFARAGAVDDLVYPPLPTYELEPVQRHVLDNGLVVLLLEDHRLPLVEARLMVRTGSHQEPSDKLGLAEITGRMLRAGGTRKRQSDELDDFLDNRAAEIETAIGLTAGEASLSCLRNDFPDVLAAFADILREPAFEEHKLAQIKAQKITGLARWNDDPFQVLSREFRKLIYGPESPYARTPTFATIEAITRDDVIALHRDAFHPDRTVLGVTGDFDPAATLALIREHFGSWPRGGPAPEPAPPAPQQRRGLYHVEKAGLTQSFIQIGGLGIRVADPDAFAVGVLNQILGLSFSSRAFTELRSRLGLSYNAFGLVTSQWDHPGLFFLSMSTSAGSTGEGLEALLELTRELAEKPPTPVEVERAKSAILSSFLFQIALPIDVLSKRVSYELYGYPLDWLERYRDGIASVTPNEVGTAAARYLKPETILVVGPKTGLDRPLESFGEVHPVDIRIPAPVAAAIADTAVNRERGAAAIALAVAGLGGEERLEALRAFEVRVKAVLTVPQGKMELTGHSIVQFPDRIRREMVFPNGSMIQVLDSDDAFAILPQGVVPLPEAQRLDLARSLLRDPLPLLKLGREGELTALAAGTMEIDGQRLERVRVDLGGETMTLGIDPQSGRVITLTYQGTNTAGVPGEIEHRYSDFRPVDGLVLPFANDSTFDGEPMIELEVESLRLDPEITEDAFARPESAPPPGTR